MAEPLLVRLNGTKNQRELFLRLLPILKNVQEIGKTGTMGDLDFEKVEFFYHCAQQYGVTEKNNNLNKRLAAEQAIQLRKKGKTLQQIADWLNKNLYKTSRGKPFRKMQVKRLLDEYEK